MKFDNIILTNNNKIKIAAATMTTTASVQQKKATVFGLSLNVSVRLQMPINGRINFQTVCCLASRN